MAKMSKSTTDLYKINGDRLKAVNLVNFNSYRSIIIYNEYDECVYILAKDINKLIKKLQKIKKDIDSSKNKE